MKQFFKAEQISFIRKISALLLLVCMVLSINLSSVLAANEYYYKGYNITYNNGDGVLYCTKSWNGGLLWLTKYKEYYYLTNSYMRCLTYYHNSWIANQEQVLTISASKIVTRKVETGVSAELGIDVDEVGTAKIGSNYETSVTTSYSASLGLSYDLSKFSHNSYKIASMGFYDKFKVVKYANGSYNKTYNVYSYDANFGQEIRLVYRY